MRLTLAILSLFIFASANAVSERRCLAIVEEALADVYRQDPLEQVAIFGEKIKSLQAEMWQLPFGSMGREWARLEAELLDLRTDYQLQLTAWDGESEFGDFHALELRLLSLERQVAQWRGFERWN